MDPTSSHLKAPETPSLPLSTEHTAAEQTTHLNEQGFSHKIECKFEPKIISRISGACRRSLQQILRDTSSELMPKRELKVLRRVIGAFILWDDGYGAQSGLLDVGLKRSNQLYSTVLSLLRSLCKSIHYGKYSLRVHILWD